MTYRDQHKFYLNTFQQRYSLVEISFFMLEKGFKVTWYTFRGGTVKLFLPPFWKRFYSTGKDLLLLGEMLKMAKNPLSISSPLKIQILNIQSFTIITLNIGTNRPDQTE